MSESFSISLDELDDIMTQILSGSRVVYVSDDATRPVPVLFQTPTSKDLLIANHIYNSYFAKASDDGFLTIEGMKSELMSRGEYTEEDENRIEEIKKQILLAKKKKFKFGAQKKLVAQIDEKVETFYKEIETIQRKFTNKLYMTCEHRASEEKLVYLSFCCSFDPYTSASIWGSWESFNADLDSVFRNNLVREYGLFNSGFSQRTIRYVARNPLWRLRYVAATKTGGNIFSVPVSDYNLDQLNLIYWSNYYLSIYEMMPEDIPPDDIIDDDDALDEYMSIVREERDVEMRERRLEKSGRLSNRGAFAHDEVIITAQDPNYQNFTYTEISKTKTDSSDLKLKNKTRRKTKERMRKG